MSVGVSTLTAEKPFVHRLSSGLNVSNITNFPKGKPDRQKNSLVETSPKSIDQSTDLKALSDWPIINERDEATGQATQDRRLVVSPYSTDSHLLDLDSVSTPCQLLAKALTVMRAVRPDYATAPYVESFNWPVVIDKLRQLLANELQYQWEERMPFYIIVFRSQIPPSTDRSHLIDLDAAAHAEAMNSGGLLKYWFGISDSLGRNLATCVWRDVNDSKRGSVGKGHKQATRETRALYTTWHVDRLRLDIGPNARTWSIVDWSD